MQWALAEAKDGKATLQLNSHWLYSRYRPYEDAEKWIASNYDEEATSYLLIGLGLGYHVQALQRYTTKKIYVYYFDKKELAYSLVQQSEQVVFINSLAESIAYSAQLLLPTTFLKAIGSTHPLHEALMLIKIQQQSFKHFGAQMLENFNMNVQQLVIKPYPKKNNNIACLIASGPSAEDTLPWLQDYQQDVDIYSVGSALAICNKYSIIPKAAIITDVQSTMVKQLKGYTGPLYYLMTANACAVEKHKGEKYPLCQQGYALAEELATQYNLPKLATGGSVATTTFSLLEYMEYDSIVLFGQDLGFTNNKTHATASTSYNELQGEIRLQVKANNGQYIQTLGNLKAYLHWFNRHCKNSTSKVYNTAVHGAKIEGVPLLTQSQFEDLIKTN